MVITKIDNNQNNGGKEVLPVPKLMAASKKTLSYKINHLLQMKFQKVSEQGKNTHYIKIQKNYGLSVNIRNNIP
jgi:hypothetical protein